MANRKGPEEAKLALGFGRNLVTLRGQVCLSQAGTAERAGLNRTEIELLEAGRRLPRLDTIVRLAGAVEARPCGLLDGLAWRLERRESGASS